MEEASISNVVEVLPVQNTPQSIGICDEGGSLHSELVTGEDFVELIECSAAATPTSETACAVLSATNRPFLSSKERFQAEVTKWEEFYDQIHKYLTDELDGTPSVKKSTPKSLSNFSIGQDGSMYFSKLNKNGNLLSLKVIRSHEERASICRDIHVSTGSDSLHHRRDKMLEILGLSYYWKGQRRDVCQCVRNVVIHYMPSNSEQQSSSGARDFCHDRAV